MKIEVSIGEALDKLSILSIKLESIKDPAKLVNIEKEYNILKTATTDVIERADIKPLYVELVLVNAVLWKIEDRIREKETRKEFDSEFIELARSVYFKNDSRAQIKKRINIQAGSDLIEEKSYSQY